ncbi:MAG: hypothetical protein KC496_15535, partial [Anaerolineae bacterium]|nr:hypothetical protein [Anaerolineae bacterium]
LSGDQFYTFFIDQGAEFAQLVDWEQLDEISPERNQMTAVCVEDYFAFYLGDRLLFEVEDDQLNGEQIGLMTISFDNGGDVLFDNLRVWEADLR